MVCGTGSLFHSASHCVSPSLLQVHSVAWSCDGSRLASGSFDKTVTIWSLESDRLVQLPTLPLPLLLPPFYPLPFALCSFFAASHLTFPLTCSPHVSPLTYFFPIFPLFFLLIRTFSSLSFPCAPSYVPLLSCMLFLPFPYLMPLALSLICLFPAPPFGA